jgi:hypothetical protein
MRNSIFWRFEQVAALCFVEVTAFLNTRVWRFSSSSVIDSHTESFELACEQELDVEAGETMMVTRDVGKAPCAEARWGLGLPVQLVPRLCSIVVAPELR